MDVTAVQRATDALLEAIEQTDVYQEYMRLRDSVMADETSRVLLKRFSSLQTTLQMAALTGAEAREEDTAAFEQLSALLYANSEITDYLLAQMKVQQLAATVMERITQQAGLEIPMP